MYGWQYSQFSSLWLPAHSFATGDKQLIWRIAKLKDHKGCIEVTTYLSDVSFNVQEGHFVLQWIKDYLFLSEKDIPAPNMCDVAACSKGWLLYEKHNVFIKTTLKFGQPRKFTLTPPCSHITQYMTRVNEMNKCQS